MGRNLIYKDPMAQSKNGNPAGFRSGVEKKIKKAARESVAKSQHFQNMPAPVKNEQITQNFYN